MRPYLILLLILVSACADNNDSGDVGNTLTDAGFIDVGTPDAGDPFAGTCPPMGEELEESVAPVRRGDMATAFDTNCNRAMMFFGDTAEPVMCGPAASIFIADGYTYDPVRRRWAAINVEGDTKPTERARSNGAWDPNSNRFILFGGRWRRGTSGAYTYFNDVWAFDPNTRTWNELSPQGAAGAPTGRMNALMLMDPDRNRILVYGGGQISADFQTFIVDGTTWAFSLDDLSWSRLNTNNGPRPRLFHTGDLDRQRGRLYVFSGGGQNSFSDANDIYGDIWYLDLTNDTWTNATPRGGDAPDPRIKAELRYDAARDQMVLFAGHDNGALGNDNDVWTFDLEALTWTRQLQGDVYNAPPIGFCDFPADFATVDPNSPERRESHLWLINGDRAYMYGGRTDCGLANDTWYFDLTTNTWTQLTESFNGMTCYRSGRTDCDEPEARKCG